MEVLTKCPEWSIDEIDSRRWKSVANNWLSFVINWSLHPVIYPSKATDWLLKFLKNQAIPIIAPTMRVVETPFVVSNLWEYFNWGCRATNLLHDIWRRPQFFPSEALINKFIKHFFEISTGSAYQGVINELKLFVFLLGPSFS